MKMKKMKMKNLKLLAAGLAMTASLTACGSSARETVQSADSSTETQANSAMQTENSQAQEAAPGETAEMTLILRGGSYAEVIKKALPDFEADRSTVQQSGSFSPDLYCLWFCRGLRRLPCFPFCMHGMNIHTA